MPRTSFFLAATFDQFCEAKFCVTAVYRFDHNFARFPGTKMGISGEERSEADDFRSSPSEFVRGETKKLEQFQSDVQNEVDLSTFCPQ